MRKLYILTLDDLMGYRMKKLRAMYRSLPSVLKINKGGCRGNYTHTLVETSRVSERRPKPQMGWFPGRGVEWPGQGWGGDVQCSIPVPCIVGNAAYERVVYSEK